MELKFNLPAVTVRSIDIDTKLDQEFDNLCVSSTDCVVKSCYAFVVGLTRVLHLGWRNTIKLNQNFEFSSNN